MRNLTDWNIKSAQDSKDAEIIGGLIAIQKLESDIIKLAETRSKRLLLAVSCAEIDKEIGKLESEMKWKTRLNLHLQKIWTNKLI